MDVIMVYTDKDSHLTIYKASEEHVQVGAKEFPNAIYFFATLAITQH